MVTNRRAIRLAEWRFGTRSIRSDECLRANCPRSWGWGRGSTRRCRVCSGVASGVGVGVGAKTGERRGEGEAWAFDSRNPMWWKSKMGVLSSLPGWCQTSGRTLCSPSWIFLGILTTGKIPTIRVGFSNAVPRKNPRSCFKTAHKAPPPRSRDGYTIEGGIWRYGTVMIN